MIKNANADKNTIESNLSNLKKLCKSKDKDMYNLEWKVSNLQGTLEKVKTGSGNLKEERNTLEKKLKS